MGDSSGKPAVGGQVDKQTREWKVVENDRMAALSYLWAQEGVADESCVDPDQR